MSWYSENRRPFASFVFYSLHRETEIQVPFLMYRKSRKQPPHSWCYRNRIRSAVPWCACTSTGAWFSTCRALVCIRRFEHPERLVSRVKRRPPLLYELVLQPLPFVFFRSPPNGDHYPMAEIRCSVFFIFAMLDASLTFMVAGITVLEGFH